MLKDLKNLAESSEAMAVQSILDVIQNIRYSELNIDGILGALEVLSTFCQTHQYDRVASEYDPNLLSFRILRRIINLLDNLRQYENGLITSEELNNLRV